MMCRTRKSSSTRIQKLMMMGVVAFAIGCGPHVSTGKDGHAHYPLDDSEYDPSLGFGPRGDRSQPTTTNPPKQKQPEEPPQKKLSPPPKKLVVAPTTIKPAPAKVITPQPFQKIAVASGPYAYEIDIDVARSFFVMRYFYYGAVLTRHQVLQHLADPAAFTMRELINDSVAKLPLPATNNGFKLQAPLINNQTKDEAFFFVAIPSSRMMRPSTSHHTGKYFNPYLFHCARKPAGSAQNVAYTQRFGLLLALPKGGIAFDNRLPQDVRGELRYGGVIFIGGYNHPVLGEIMVSPCPEDADLDSNANAHQGHIYAFARAFNGNTHKERRRIQSFWFAVGKAAEKMFDGVHIRDWQGNIENTSSLYLNTHGEGVPYLHFRVETKPLHYQDLPALTNHPQSVTYYKAIFP